MSISLTLINKSAKEYNIREVISPFIQAVNNNYTNSEMEHYVSNQGESCLSVFFQAKGFETKKQSDFTIKNINNNGRNMVLIKRKFELKKEGDFWKILDNTTSPFVVLELTSMISRLEMRPPWVLSGGQLVFPVGMIGTYFRKIHDSPYKDNSKGLGFAKDFPHADQSEIATAYYDKFVREENMEDLTNPEITGLVHFTTVVAQEGKKLRFSFMQNQTKIARYFFEPDIMFSSNEVVARSVRRTLYPDQDILMRGNLRFYEVTI